MSGKRPGHQRKIWNANDESSVAPAAHVADPAHLKDGDSLSQGLATNRKARAKFMFAAEDFSWPYAALDEVLLNALRDTGGFTHQVAFVALRIIDKYTRNRLIGKLSAAGIAASGHQWRVRRLARSHRGGGECSSCTTLSRWRIRGRS